MLEHAVRALAGECDGSGADDGRGFSAPDQRLGSTLARIPAAAWGPQAERAAWEMLGKYRRQLADLGVA